MYEVLHYYNNDNDDNDENDGHNDDVDDDDAERFMFFLERKYL